ncbi:MAG: aldo/keto reductase [Eubacteriales bacterium]|nr:aldo/keto reductase [Eubacteriales bacterium]
MEKTIFGKTKLEVSPITLGTWGIGGAGWDDYPDEVRLDTIKAAVEAGINLIDTAPAYNGGRSEQYIGRALEEIGARKDVYIVTKTGNDFIDGQYVRNGKADNIFALCERSLRNLRTDYIDILLLHWPDPKVSLEETFGAMNRLKEQGIIGHIGASNLTKDQMIEAEKYTEIEVYQPHFSMLTQENEETIRWAHEKGIGVMAYGSLGGGLLTGRYRTVETYETMDNRNRFYGRFFQEPFFSRVMLLLEDMQAIADRHGAAVSEVALNWSRQKPYIDTCIVGAQKRSRVESNVKCLDWNLTAEEMDMLDAAIREKLAD